MKSIVDKAGLFIRDDFTANDGEIALDVAPAQGFYLPKWDGKQWVEGRTYEELAPILAAKAQAETEQANRLSIEDQAVKALATNKAYINSTPTAAQTTAEVKALARQVNGIIRLLLNKLDATD